MSPLGAATCRILRDRVSESDPRITYAELARRLRDVDDAFEHITHRGQELYAALCDLGGFCKKMKLPPLPALVVRADTRRPGDAYYEGMPERYRGERIAVWRRDLEAVRGAAYPRLSAASIQQRRRRPNRFT